jgi:hypothetical protein
MFNMPERFPNIQPAGSAPGEPRSQVPSSSRRIPAQHLRGGLDDLNC